MELQVWCLTLLTPHWLSLTSSLGVAQGGSLEYFRTSQQNAETLRIRRINAMYNVRMANTLVRLVLILMIFYQMSSLRAEDHSTIGALLGSLLIPALFWKRAKLIHC